MIIKENQRLMFITNRTTDYSEIDEIRMVLEGGCNWIQLRMKNTLDLQIARDTVTLCRDFNAENICCINDDVEMALLAGANAVHLGREDLSVEKAWELIKAQQQEERFLVGATANTFDDIKKAYEAGASYIGLGPYRHTETKANLSPVLGLEGYKDIMTKCKKAGIDIPVYAIGGIEIEDVEPLMALGIQGIAVSGAILRADDPTAETRRFLQEIYK